MKIKNLKFEQEKGDEKRSWSFSLHDDRAIFKSSRREDDIVWTGWKFRLVHAGLVAIFVVVGLLGVATPWAVIEAWLHLLG